MKTRMNKTLLSANKNSKRNILNLTQLQVYKYPIKNLTDLKFLEKSMKLLIDVALAYRYKRI